MKIESCVVSVLGFISFAENLFENQIYKSEKEIFKKENKICLPYPHYYRLYDKRKNMSFCVIHILYSVQKCQFYCYMYLLIIPHGNHLGY